MASLLRWLTAGWVALALCAPALAGDDPATTITTAMKAHLASLKKQSADPAQYIATRDFTNAAFGAMLLDGDGTTAEDFLRRAYDTQELTTTSPNYGYLRWSTTDSQVTDLNAIEFGAESVGPLLLDYGDKLSPDFMKYFRPRVAAAIVAMRAHDVPVHYTNIYLMKLVNMMLLGEATGDDAAVADARKMLDAWIDFTQSNGIHEFDSPTYYSVDLDCLVTGYHYAANPDDREKFRRILDYFWTDIAANLFLPAQKICGPYSRDYDFLAGGGALDSWLAIQGWGDPKALTSRDLQGVFLLNNFRPGGYQVPDAIVQLAHSGPRQVISTWDEDRGHIRTAWLGNKIAMGTTSGDYGPQDKLFAATFAGPPNLAQVTLVVDGYDSPYGFRKERDSTGHLKPVHLQSNLASVQSGGLAILTLDVDPSKLPKPATELATNFVFPSQATIQLDGAPATLPQPGRLTVKPSSCITLSTGGGYFGIRLISVENLNGSPPTYELVSDTEGITHHAFRLKLTHESANVRQRIHHLHMAILIIASDDDPTHTLMTASVNNQIAGDRWTVSATSGQMTLQLVRSVTDHNYIISDEINGVRCVPARLSINGQPATALAP